jgi:translocation and assembly module TamA
LFVALAGGGAQAADPQPYTVKIADTGNAELDQALSDSSNLIGLNADAPVSPFALVLRAREDGERFLTALRSFGYYQGKAQIRIAGRELDDPALLDTLNHAPAEPPTLVQIGFDLGPLFHLRKIALQGDVPAAAHAQLSLRPGAPANAVEVLDQRERLLAALLQAGYAQAKIAPPDAVLVAEAHALDVIYHIEAGPVTKLGKLSIRSQGQVDAEFLQRHLKLEENQRFDPAALENARRDLAALGVFSSVQVKPGEAVDAQGRLPIEFATAERPRRSLSLSANYSTDLGGALTAGWRHRNVFGAAEQLILNAGAAQFGGNSTTGLGYLASTTFIKPDFLRRAQSLQADAGVARQGLNAYNRDAVSADVLLLRQFDAHWKGSLGLSIEQARIEQNQSLSNYTLFGLPATLKFDNTDNLYDPRQGLRADATLTPMQSLNSRNNASFALASLSGSTYLDLSAGGRSIFALRGLVGGVMGAPASSLPPDKRFYAGGGGTVRGFKFQALGPRLPNDQPRGGAAVVAGSVEFRQRLFERYGAVLFLDAGQVSDDKALFSGRWGLGAGLGARYFTALGPVRLDLALPLNRRPGDGAFEIYLGLGQAF